MNLRTALAPTLPMALATLGCSFNADPEVQPLPGTDSSTETSSTASEELPIDLGTSSQGITLSPFNYPDSDVFERCRVARPGIETLVDGPTAGFDSSGLGSSQHFSLSGSGEWDDNANYQRFMTLVERAPVHESVDISNRQFVVVVDERGRGVGNCTVNLSDEGGTHVALTTLPNGQLPFFPGVYGFRIG